MKLLQAVFSVQLCLVLSASQAFALAGGPVYDSVETYTGDYSGALIGAEIAGEGSAVESGDDVVFSDTTPSDALGLFSVGVPSVGLASGPVYIFTSGRVYQGDLQAFVDPNGGSLTGQVNARYDFSVTEIVPTGIDDQGRVTFESVTTPVTATATGSINASIAEDTSAYSGSVNSIRINGNARLEISDGQVTNSNEPIISQVIEFQVIGYKQSDSQSIAAGITDLTATGE